MMPAVTSGSGPGSFSDPGIQKLLSSLDQLESKVDGSRPDLLFLRTLLESPEFSSLLRMHDMVTTPEAKDPPPICESALEMISDVDDLMSHLTPMPEAQELSKILQDPHLGALLDAHDQIAMREFQPQLPEIPHEVDEDEESIKIVRLVKGPQEPLGATIQMDEEQGRIRIARVMHGGAADRSGLIHTGDEVVEVNKVKVSGKTPTEVVRILSGSVGPITLKLIPGDLDPNNDRESKIFMRALFDYDPSEDKYIPCREAGLGFRKGDILNIVSQDDPNWWQAKRVDDKSLRAGLVPGRQLQERKEVLKVAVHGETSLKDNKRADKLGSKFSPKLNKKNKKTKKLPQSTQNEELSAEDISTYEEVHQCCPESAINRTIVLVGPAGVGCTTLQNHLIKSDPERFKRPLTCTSRPKKSGEGDADFIHMSKMEMERDVVNKKFYEHWEHKGHLYGSAIDHVRDLCTAGSTPVLTCSQPQLLHTIWTSDVKPYCILVKPPSLSELKSTRAEAKAKYYPEDKHPRAFTETEFQDMVETAETMERNFAHYFSNTLVNGTLTAAQENLSEILEAVGTEPQWIPLDWLEGR